MIPKITLVCLVSVATVAWGQASLSKDAQSKPAEPLAVTVAILNFEVESPGNPDLGSQMADILTVRMSIEDGLQLVERAKLGKILDEQKLKLVGLVDQQQAVQVGKLSGAKLMVLGKAFTMDKKLMIVTKVVGVETGRVVGALRQVEMSKPISDVIPLVSEDVVELIRKKASQLLPDNKELPDPLAAIKAKLGDRPRPTVAVVIPEGHLTRVVVDPAVETEIKHSLLACGYKVVDVGKNSLADWAKAMFKDKTQPWPAALNDADVVVVGEAFSEFALRTGELVTCTARAEVNLIDRQGGQILLADRQMTRAVDLAEATAGKTALQLAGHKLAIEICQKLTEYKLPAAKLAPAKASPATGPAALLIEPAQSSWDLDMMLPVGEGPASLSAAAPAATTRPVKRTVFAAPFENATGQEQYDPAAAGMPDLVAVLLAQQEHIAVVERQRLAALAEEQARSLKGLTGQGYAVAAGKLLKADTVLTGRLFLVQGKLTVNCKALDIASERVVAADELSCRPEDIMESSLQMARNLGKAMSLPLPEIDLKQIDKSPIASLHFAQALSNFYAGNMDAAIMQFMRTIDLDPNYAEASYWCGLAYARQGEFGHAAIEWEKYLKDCPDAPNAAAVQKMLADAKEREKQSAAPRLSPTTVPSQPAPGAPSPGQ